MRHECDMFDLDSIYLQLPFWEREGVYVKKVILASLHYHKYKQYIMHSLMI